MESSFKLFLDFTIIAIAIFITIKALNTFQRKLHLAADKEEIKAKTDAQLQTETFSGNQRAFERISKKINSFKYRKNL